MYTDYYLRFPDQQTALEALCLAFGDDGEGVPLNPYPGALDLIGVAYRNDTSNTVSVGDIVRITGAYRTNDYAVSMNGDAVGVDTSGNMPTGLNQITFSGTVEPGYYWLRRLTYYPVRLPDSELRAIAQ